MSDNTLKRRWYQFSLRSLLIVMLVFVVTVGWIGSRMHRAWQNRDRVATVNEAVTEIEKSGGKITSEYEGLRPQTWLEKRFDDPGGPDDPVGVLTVTLVRFDTNLSDATAEYLTRLSNLKKLSLRGALITDTSLKHLARLTQIESLDLEGARITDAGLDHLKSLTNLRSLILYDTNVTDAGLEHLKELKHIEALNLEYCKATDAGLEHLKGMTNLKHLWVTNVTDAGLEHLRGMTHLKSLDLMNTNVTKAGAKKLRQALPNCGIYHLSLPPDGLFPSQ